MESAVLLSMTLFLVAGCSGKLDRDAQDFEGYPVSRSSAAPSSLSSVYPGGIVGNPYISPDEESTEANIGYKTQGNLRKSFSYIQTKKPRAKARYEALKSNINEPFNTYASQNKTSFEAQKDENFSTEQSKSEVDGTSTKRSVSGPNVDGQQPYRHWSTESNVIREEHPDGLYQSYPYVTPAYSRQETDYSGGNLKKLIEVSTEGYNQESTNPQRPLFKPKINYDHLAVIPATTYRPATRDGYSFSFESKNHSRHETGDTKGNFRGSIKYASPYGESKEINYEGNPRIGITTSERTPVVNIPARSGQRYITPIRYVPPTSTSRPFLTTRKGLTYSYSSPATGYQYSPSTSSTTQTPFTSTPQSEVTYRRGKTVYQPPQFYLQPVQTYDYIAPSLGDPYMYYTESPQYVQLSPEYGAYTFTYNAGDHERTESRDNQGNVHGMFSFEGTDGERRQVNYEANSEKGFVARGQHLPVQTRDSIGSQDTYPQSTQSTGNDESPGTYFFSYNAGEHMREEHKDEQGNIHGMYRYMAGDGKIKTVKYRASASEGFVATGDDIPNAQNGYSYSYTIGNQPQTGSGNKYQPETLIR
ncbi:uncharacterized protein [Halyomorpha halys]|uniref:uncharacterized protein isoform X2 n=1 Tax=Halyomorpha halys TaxID=286706 RepID=UPI0006D52422|nr:uncharacterized protein LOC106689581 isoform X2 [Halyomorpha halys]